jgi:hypothetical protein
VSVGAEPVVSTTKVTVFESALLQLNPSAVSVCVTLTDPLVPVVTNVRVAPVPVGAATLPEIVQFNVPVGAGVNVIVAVSPKQ